MKVVLDSHAAAWNVLGTLPPPTAEKLEGMTPADLAISDVTLTELARVIRRGQLKVKGDPEAWLRAFATRHRVIAVDAAIAWRAASYGFAHKDPVDRHILATADKLKLPLVTVDSVLTREAPKAGVRVIW